MNSIFKFLIGAMLALLLASLLLACGDPSVQSDLQVVRIVEANSWAPTAQVVRDPHSERCYLRSTVHGGWSYMLLPDCK